MPFANNLVDREIDKFRETANNNTAVAVILDDAMRAPANSDSATVAYPSVVQEVYSFRSGGISGTILKTLTVNYTDASKDNIASWAWA